MKGIFTTVVMVMLAIAAFAQNGTLEGIISDDANEPLFGANIYVNEAGTGTTTDEDGKYSLSLPAGNYSVAVTYTGYAKQEATVDVMAGKTTTLNFNLSIGTNLDVVVVSGSKKREKLTESPATIETIFARQIQEFAGNPGDLIARQKGIDYFRAGMVTPAFNIRGFNSNFNSKNLQVIDGRFSNLIATGLPLGPLASTIKEDIEQVEIILGPNATLYGPNAHNGLMNTITKDPRNSAGTTIALNPGVNGDGNAYFSGRLRHAQVINDKFSFKLSGEYMRGTEFEYADSVFIDRVGAFDSLGNPMRDGIKEGYEEFDLDPTISFLRGEAALYYSPTDDLDIIFNTGYSNSNYLSATNVGRNQIKDWMMNYYQLRLSGEHWFAQVYYTTSRTDSTYAIDERTKRYYQGIDSGLSPAEAAGAFSYTSGALFVDDSKRWNAEAQYNNSFGDLDVVVGLQYQLDQADSKGTYLLDQDGSIDISQIGGYAHLTYDFGRGWRALAAGRADNHEIYDFNFVPKFGLLKISDRGTWRLTYGQGIAAPTILNMFGNLFGGLILGNAEGFTLANGDVVEKQKVEKIQTIELGYRGQVVKNKLFVDANAYYNISKDFLSPVTVVGVATERGDTPIADVQSAFGVYGGLVATYINFGEVNTYGFDLGVTYYFNPRFSAFVNYSYFDYSVEENEENDFNGDGEVDFLDVLVNAPTHKGGLGLNYSGSKWFGSAFGRWVQVYDYFSSFQIASRSYPDKVWRGTPIIEDARSTDTYNYGPLGGFFTMDFSLGYRINKMFTVTASATNAFNQELREFTATAPTRGMYALELRVDLPAISGK